MSAPLLARQDEIVFHQYRENLPQALIVAGEDGLDREATVDSLAHAQPSEVITIVPEKDKKHISVEQIRALISSIRTHALRRRIIIIRLAEHMTEVAQNALLKALEEPSHDTIFLLESEEPSRLLPTILSRCQIFTLHRTSALQDNTLLKQSGLDQTSVQQIRFLAAGRPALIREFIKTPKKLSERRDIIKHAKILLGNASSYEALAAVYTYSTNRDQALKLIDVIVTLIRFQLTSHGPQPALTSLLERTERTEAALRANGNVKLALLQLTI